MKPKEHKIETFQDMVNCTTPENLDNFLKDLKGLIATQHMVRAACELGGVDYKEVETVSIKWIDDGKHDITNEMRAK